MAKHTPFKMDSRYMPRMMEAADAGLHDILTRVAAAAKSNAPVGKEPVKKGTAARIGYLAQPAPTLPGITNTWKNEWGGRASAYASDVRTRFSGKVTGNPSLAWKIEAFVPSRERRGSEISVPYENVRFKRRYGGKKSGSTVYHHKHLADSMEIEIDGVGEKSIGTVTANRPYAWYVEKGTTKQPPQHYMERALTSVAADIKAGRLFKETG